MSSEINNTESISLAQHDREKEAFPPFDSSTFPSQLLWLLITFSLFYYLMSKVALPRISSILEMRGDRIAEDLDAAHRFKTESDDALAAYEQELSDARLHAHNINRDIHERAKNEIEAKLLLVEDNLTKKIGDSEIHLTKIKASAMSEIGLISEDVVQLILSQFLSTNTSIDKAEISSAVAAVSKARS
ncbi:F0F1 ATP synthase subunit B [Candidatus Endowatersipora endosymbiont of Watersipora subatra]|uniref:F0F1 ATP synthase subunit B n=1 Tax=Candidatus Endowatersipora endosymbiont of Watersipora subatra TaxID=3077946 RepID=UPI00312CB07C